MKKEEQDQPTSGVFFFEELVKNEGRCPQVYYNARTMEKVEINPGESKLLIRSRRDPKIKHWSGRVQFPVEE